MNLSSGNVCQTAFGDTKMKRQCLPNRFWRHENEAAMFVKPLSATRNRTYLAAMLAKRLSATRNRTYLAAMFAKPLLATRNRTYLAVKPLLATRK
ncbi:Hypothetical protein, putative [Bodo saltans]|uniref:Uncharacterized protein n=1 Tax=Bodo saltans TaxID=75058 RepID=A0A0S4IQU3_BODSA|nr:Hypothetical protein, putative [Bodo saltans]|eukprot:CUF30170.1 Hypothetical protein, putative [Bodo saltans]